MLNLDRMEINKKKFVESLKEIFEGKENDENLVRLWVSGAHGIFSCRPFSIEYFGFFFYFRFQTQRSPSNLEMDEALAFLNEKILDPDYTEKIGSQFRDTLLLIISNRHGRQNKGGDFHLKKCIALSKLLKYSPDVQRFVQSLHICCIPINYPRFSLDSV